MQRAVERHHEGTARVIPIILEACSWKYSNFKHLQVLPKDGKPVTSWDRRAEAFFDVEEGIRRVVDALNAERQAEAARAREAEELKQQQEEAARLERERQERERLAAEQRQREAEAQRQEQERLERERLAVEQRQREQAEAQRHEQERQQQAAQKQQNTQLSEQEQSCQRDADNQDNDQQEDSSSAADGAAAATSDGSSGEAGQNPLINKMTLWEIPLNRRSTLGWLAAAIGGGGLLVWGATSGNGASQSKPAPSDDSSSSTAPGNGSGSDNLPETTPLPDSFGKALKLQTFSFPVVTLNGQGQEISRVQKQNKYFVEDLGQGVGLDMVAIPGGSFLMGSPDGEGYSDEKPQHRVTVNPFYMGKYEVTQAQWKAVAAMPQVGRDLNPDPSSFKGAMRPVENVSWDDAVEFCQRLSRYTSRHYRLPSEAEWEYACRAGTTTPFHIGSAISREFVNCKRNLGMAIIGLFAGETTEVGSYKVANAFGLYDMHGNVWEWCQDVWHGSYEGAPTDGSAWMEGGDQTGRVLRGGSWFFFPAFCRSALRYRVSRDYLNYSVGFRVVWVPA